MIGYSDYLDEIIALDVGLPKEGLPKKGGHRLFGSGLEEMPKLRKRILSADKIADFGHHSRGNPELKRRVLDHFCDGNPAVSVTLAPGISAALCVVCHALLQTGDAVAAEELAYPPMLDAAREVTQEEPLLVPRDENGKLDLERLRELLETHEVKLFLITNPHNPTSALLTEEDLRGVADTFDKVGSEANVVVDEAFLGLVPAEHCPPPSVTLDTRFISISGLTKSWGLTWLRCGWILAHGRIAEFGKARILTQNFGSDHLEYLAERALATGILHDVETWAGKTLRKNAIAFAEEFQPVLDEGLIESVGTLAEPGFLRLFRVVGESSAEPLIEFLRIENQVYVSPGGWFGSDWEDAFRVNLALRSRKFKRGICALAKGIREFAKRK